MAILAADVAGYSRLVGADEEGTLARWKAHWRELIDPKITEHGGRIVRVTGDKNSTQGGGCVSQFTLSAVRGPMRRREFITLGRSGRAKRDVEILPDLSPKV